MCHAGSIPPLSPGIYNKPCDRDLHLPRNMFNWIRATTAGLAFSTNLLDQTDYSAEGLVSQETLKWVETIRQKYDIPGISLGVIASPNRTGRDWVTEAHGFGHMDAYGRNIDGGVGSRIDVTEHC